MKNFLVALTVVILFGGGYLLWQGYSAPRASSVLEEDNSIDLDMLVEESIVNETEAVEGTVISTSVPMAASISYNGSQFSPSTVSVKRGGAVTWTAVGGSQMWVASAQHPTPSVYHGTTLQQHCPDIAGVALDQCTGGSTYSFTFDTVGSWNYHNHLNPTAFGTVTVVE